MGSNESCSTPSVTNSLIQFVKEELWLEFNYEHRCVSNSSGKQKRLSCRLASNLSGRTRNLLIKYGRQRHLFKRQDEPEETWKTFHRLTEELTPPLRLPHQHHRHPHHHHIKPMRYVCNEVHENSQEERRRRISNKMPSNT